MNRIKLFPGILLLFGLLPISWTALAAGEKATAGERVLVALDLRSEDLEPETLKRINSRVADILRKESGASLVTQGELDKWMEFGKESGRFECLENKECIISISKTVKNDLLFGGTIGKVGGVWTVNLHLFDAKKAETLARAIREELEQAGHPVLHRTNQYLNNLIEQDHRGIKSRYDPMKGFGAFESAARFCRAYDELRNFYRPATTRNENISLSERRRIHTERTAELMRLLMAA